MAEYNPLVYFHEVLPVIVNFARRGAPVIKGQHAGGNPFGIKAEPNGVGAERGDEEVGRVDWLAAPGSQDEVSPSTKQRYGQPDYRFDGLVHHARFPREGCRRRIVLMIGVLPQGSISNTNEKVLFWWKQTVCIWFGLW